MLPELDGYIANVICNSQRKGVVKIHTVLTLFPDVVENKHFLIMPRNAANITPTCTIIMRQLVPNRSVGLSNSVKWTVNIHLRWK